MKANCKNFKVCSLMVCSNPLCRKMYILSEHWKRLASLFLTKQRTNLVPGTFFGNSETEALERRAPGGSGDKRGGGFRKGAELRFGGPDSPTGVLQISQWVLAAGFLNVQALEAHGVLKNQDVPGTLKKVCICKYKLSICENLNVTTNFYVRTDLVFY